MINDIFKTFLLIAKAASDSTIKKDEKRPNLDKINNAEEINFEVVCSFS